MSTQRVRTHEPPDFDVGVIGGGPAGACIAAYLGRAGVRTVVFERALVPREHAGESLVPSSTRVFRDIGFLDTMERERFPRKYGAVWTVPGSTEHGAFHFDSLDADCQLLPRNDTLDQPGTDRSYTYHVDRGRFDLLLLQHAHRLGATVYQGVAVSAVDFERGPYPLVRYTMGRKELSTSVRIVVDASGRRTLLGNQLSLKMLDAAFDQYAIHAWFEGYARAPGARDAAIADYSFMHFLPVGDTWVWQIPVTDTITSIGVVMQKSSASQPAVSGEAFFWRMLESRPQLAERVRGAQQVRPFSEEGDCRYAMKQTAGDRFLLIGDAARFVDPIFSTGVSLALNSARFAQRDILAALETGTFGRPAFKTYETTIQCGTKNWQDFLTVYYRLKVVLLQLVNSREHRRDVLKLLQGDIYDEEQPAVLTHMRQAMLEIERDPSHPWHRQLQGMAEQAFQRVF